MIIHARISNLLIFPVITIISDRNPFLLAGGCSSITSAHTDPSYWLDGAVHVLHQQIEILRTDMNLLEYTI